MKTVTNAQIFTFFTGAGFLDLGFEDAGFQSVFANEICDDFSDVYTYSRKIMGREMPRFGLQRKSIDDFLLNETDKQYLRNAIADVRKDANFVGFIGGPPCPDFSVAGKNAGSKGEHGRLSTSYANIIIENNPDFFVFENVKGLWRTARHRAFFDSLVRRFRRAGYCTTTRLINAVEYGAPQERERIILIGIKKTCLLCTREKSSDVPDFPWEKFVVYPMERIQAIKWPTTNDFKVDSIIPQPANIIPELTVQYWFDKNDVLHHPNARDYFVPRAGLKKMLIYAEGDDSKKCYKRLNRWRFSPTVAYGNNEVHLHPYKARRISVAEALSLQSLPPSFSIQPEISLSAKFKTIGNGVPYLAALGVAKTLMSYLANNCKGAKQ